MKIVFRTSPPGERGGGERRRNRPCLRELQRLDQLADLGAFAWQQKRMVPRHHAVVAKLPSIEKWAFDLGCREAGYCVNAVGPGPKDRLDTKKNTKAAETPAMEREMPRKKTGFRARTPRVAGSNRKTRKKVACSAEGSGKQGSSPAPDTKGVRPGTKKEKILRLLKRSGGATMKELIQATGWQPHSVRGFLSAAVTKKMGLKVLSAKAGNTERRYSVKA